MNMKYIYTITFGLILTALAVAIGAAKSATFPTHVLEQVTSNVYKVVHPRIGTGTGLWLTPSLMLTNCHMAGENRVYNIKAVSFDKSQYFAMKMVLCDKENDLAIMESDTPNYGVTPTTLAAEPIQFGEALLSAGYGYSQDLSLKIGTAGLPFVDGDENYRRAMTLPTSGPGDSGSPVYNEAGQLVGLLNSGISNSGGKAFFVRLEVVRNYLRNLMSKINRAKGTGQ